MRRILDSYGTVLVLLAVGAALMVSTTRSFRRYQNLKTAEEAAQRRLTAIDNARSDDELAGMSEDELVLEAKRRLGYKRPEETAVLIVRNGEASPTDHPLKSEHPSTRSSFLRWWHYLIGDI